LLRSWATPPANEFARAPAFDWDKLEELFKQKIFRLLLNEGRIPEEFIEKLGTWRHSNFHVFCGDPIEPGNETSMGNLARYIIRASLSQERMTYVEDGGKVIYQAKDGYHSLGERWACGSPFTTHPYPRDGSGNCGPTFCFI